MCHQNDTLSVPLTRVHTAKTAFYVYHKFRSQGPILRRLLKPILMKNVIALLFCAFLCCGSLLAQRQFGIKAGANFGDIIETIEVNTDIIGGGLETMEYELRVTPQLGIWLDLPLSDKLSLQPELLWTQKILQPQENNPMETYINFHYFSLPVLAKYKLGNFRIELGPEASFLLEQSFENVDGPLTESPAIDEYVFEFALNVGLQYNYKRWTIGARASRDLTPFLDFEVMNPTGEVLIALKDFHRSGVIWVGYQIL